MHSTLWVMNPLKTRGQLWTWVCLQLGRFRIAFTANGKREIRVNVFLKKMSTWVRVMQNNSGLWCWRKTTRKEFNKVTWSFLPFAVILNICNISLLCSVCLHGYSGISWSEEDNREVVTNFKRVILRYVCGILGNLFSFFFLVSELFCIFQVYLRHLSIMLMYNFPEQYSDALRLLCEGESTCLSTVLETS